MLNVKKMSEIKHFIDLDKLSKSQLNEILNIAADLKNKKSFDEQSQLLKYKNLAMIFEKTSTRTRVSFEVAINQLGGSAIVMNSSDMQIGKGETIEDTAKVLSRFVDGIMIRSNSHQTIIDLANNASIPIINALSDFSHPCQILASLLTIKEHLGEISGKKLVWLGDENNVLNSYIHAALPFDFELVISTPQNYNFSLIEMQKAQKNGAKISKISNPQEAVKNADVIITDTWFSMGDESAKNQSLKERKISELKNYQVNSELMKLANKDAIFTHCLPAYREYEVSGEVIDGKNSVIFDEAENRLHAQKAILLWSMK
jgi:ornithine carbamoyltransferase